MICAGNIGNAAECEVATAIELDCVVAGVAGDGGAHVEVCAAAEGEVANHGDWVVSGQYEGGRRIESAGIDIESAAADGIRMTQAHGSGEKVGAAAIGVVAVENQRAGTGLFQHAGATDRRP